MNNTRRNFHRIMLTTAIMLSVATVTLPAQGTTAEDLNQDAAQALQSLYKSHPEAERLSKTARAVLVFPKIIKAVQYLGTSKGWEFGVDPNVVVVNEDIAKNLFTSTMKDDAYAYIFDQQGLMTSLSIEGTKISPIKQR